MPSYSPFQKAALKRAAAGLYMSEPNGSAATGRSWQELDEGEKEIWMAKAHGKGKK